MFCFLKGVFLCENMGAWSASSTLTGSWVGGMAAEIKEVVYHGMCQLQSVGRNVPVTIRCAQLGGNDKFG
jgi:hypothetical protein